MRFFLSLHLRFGEISACRKLYVIRIAIKLKCTGNKEFRSLMNMLIKFGEYSGVGIKNSMGMGAIRLREQGGNKSNE